MLVNSFVAIAQAYLHPCCDCEMHQSPIVSILRENEGLPLLSIGCGVVIPLRFHRFYFQLR